MLANNTGWQVVRSIVDEVDGGTVTTTRSSGNADRALLKHYFGVRDVFGNTKPAYCGIQEIVGINSTCDVTTTLVDPTGYVYLPFTQKPGIPTTRQRTSNLNTVETPLSVTVSTIATDGMPSIVVLLASICTLCVGTKHVNTQG